MHEACAQKNVAVKT